MPKFSPRFTRLAGDIGRAFRNFRYELMDDGRILVGARTVIGGVFANAHAPAMQAFGELAYDPNRLVTQGLVDMLNTYFRQKTPPAGFFLVPFEGNATPDASWTAANFNANADEFTAYTSANRLPWTAVDATTTPIVGNTASLAQLTLNPTDGPFNIYGAGLATSQVKGGAGGVLVAATRFANPRLNLAVNDKLALEYVFTASDVADLA